MERVCIRHASRIPVWASRNGVSVSSGNYQPFLTCQGQNSFCEGWNTRQRSGFPGITFGSCSASLRLRVVWWDCPATTGMKKVSAHPRFLGSSREYWTMCASSIQHYIDGVQKCKTILASVEADLPVSRSLVNARASIRGQTGRLSISLRDLA